MSSDIEVDDHAASIEVICGQHVIAGPLNQDSLPTVASQISHSAGLAPVPYTGRNSLRNFLAPEGFDPARVP